MTGHREDDDQVKTDHGLVEIDQTTDNNNNDVEGSNNNNNPRTRTLNERKTSWGKLRRVDSLHMEAGRVSHTRPHGSDVSWQRTLSLAFQCIGVIYGDIGTSPLYVFSSTFPDGIGHKDDLLGVLSLIIYTILLVPVLKYVFIVLRANDNGDGGTFALYSLICRYIKVSLIPNDQPEDREVSNYNLISNQLQRAQGIRKTLETKKAAQISLFIVTILGTSMVIGDGILTPCISVLSAVSGIKALSTDVVMWISIVILVLIFCAQRLGTDKVGYTFAPIISIWFLFISGIGLYNLVKYDITVLRAFNPKYIVDYFVRNGKKSWVSLGGVILCITGTEAMFADLGHFNIRAVQISFSGVVLPSILTAYCGQTAYLVKFPEHVDNTFYASIPDPIYWPTFVVAVAAAIIASQAMISGAFAIISQSLSLGCFPRVKVIHTSSKYEGQVYIPEVNYILMIACVLVTLAFKTTQKIGNAYGIAVVAVMIITTCLVTLIMLVIWKTSIWLIIAFFVVFFSIECLYFSSVLYKFVQGGFFPLAFAAVLMTIMGTWHYVHKKRYEFELENKISTERIKELIQNPKVNRVPGIGLLYSELVQGVPPIFLHFIDNIPSVHSVLLFVSIKSLPISKVAIEERYVFRQVEPRDYHMYRCVVRYGYKDPIEQPKEFERQIVEHLKDFIRHEYFIREGGGVPIVEDNVGQPQTQHRVSNNAVHVEETLDATTSHSNSIISSNNGVAPIQDIEDEMEYVQRAHENGVFYLLGEAEVRAKENSSLFKKFVVNYAYGFLRKNSRQGEKVLAIPKTRLLRVGMTYEI